MGRLEGKSVIITGAGSGIGRAASLLFTREGARLIAVDRSENVKETAKLVSDAGGTVEAVMADAGSEADVKAFIDKAVTKYGRLDAIWANAGVSGGLVPLGRADPGTLAGSAARQPDRTVPRDQAFDTAHDQAEVGLDRLHRLGRGAQGRRQRTSLRREQGRRDQPRADHGLFAVRHRRAHQRGVPGPDRNRHDQAGVRSRQGARHRRQDRPAQSAEARRASRTNWPRWDCSLPATTRPMSTDRRSRSTAVSPRRCRMRGRPV